MIYILADNILSPLGNTTEQNYQALKDGCSVLQRYEHFRGVPEPYVASLFTEEQLSAVQTEGLTLFESLVVASAKRAIGSVGLDVKQKKVIFILSSTKANIELLEQGNSTDDEFPGVCAERIAKAIGVTTMPITVCNACISGVSAIILAERLLESKLYDYAIVSGADRQTRFVISGFQSFKAVSDELCRPFDIERLGLNLGEAVATMILSANKDTKDECWGVARGAIRNDAYHISAPSKKGEGALLALNAVCKGRDIDGLAFVNAHGTATMFNDQMESVAIERASLTDIPVNGLKGYYGHTLGAAGILETIISARSCDDGLVLGTKGFGELGVSGKIRVSDSHQPCRKTGFLKMISGFGGCNAAVWVTKDSVENQKDNYAASIRATHHVTITPETVVLDEKEIHVDKTGKDLIVQLYKTCIGDYPKFYKMDKLSRLGFVASELLLAKEDRRRFEECEDRAIILFNRSASVDTDKLYLKSISDDDYFPSPSLFVYTLPNIVSGEIAIRNLYHGETSFYVLPSRNDRLMKQIVEVSVGGDMTRSAICGWIDYENEQRFVADLFIIEKQS